MRIVHAATALKTGGRKVCLAIGFFDGVHLGHQQLIRQTISDARKHEGIALIVTFDRHPSEIVAPRHIPPLIYPLAHRLEVIRSAGPDALLLLNFNRELSLQSGAEFIRQLVRELGQVQSMAVGANFLFGHQRSGNVALLKKLGRELNFVVHGMSAVALDGKPVSSTRIREAVQQGRLDDASQMLGRPYSVVGIVRRGDRLGHQLGFPTANLDIAGLVLPPNGVYTVQVRAGKRTWRGVMNIGYRPTLTQPKPALRVEAHLLGFKGDLYGKTIEVAPLDKIRGERRFESLAALKEQIARDIGQAQSFFEGTARS